MDFTTKQGIQKNAYYKSNKLRKGLIFMLCKTHIAGGIAATLLYKNLCNVPIDQMILLIPSGIIGSLIPDLDSKNSKLNQKLQVTKIFSLCKHRGIMHTPILYAILWLISLFLIQNSIARIVIYGLLLGVLSHLILDMLNPMGIRVFYQVRRKTPVFRHGDISRLK